MVIKEFYDIGKAQGIRPLRCTLFFLFLIFYFVFLGKLFTPFLIIEIGCDILDPAKNSN